MEHYELRLSVAGQDAVARLQQFGVTGKIAAVKRPIRMIVQFLEALVETVDGKEESFRIRNVDRHRDSQRPARFPHGIEPLVIHFHEWPRRDVLTQVEPQGLKNLQSAC